MASGRSMGGTCKVAPMQVVALATSGAYGSLLISAEISKSQW
jgi:hypothetical protein